MGYLLFDSSKIVSSCLSGLMTLLFFASSVEKVFAQTTNPVQSSDVNSLTPEGNPLNLPTQVEGVTQKTIVLITLKEALELARQNNRQLQVVQQQLYQAQINVQVAESSYLPSLSLGVDLNSSVVSLNTIEGTILENAYSEVGLPYPFPAVIEGVLNVTTLTPEETTLETTAYESPTTTLDTTFTISYLLYAGGKRSGNLQASQEQVKINTLELEKQKQTLELQTRNAYYDIQKAQAEIDIATSTLKNSQITLYDAQALKDGGFATIADVLQAQVQVANAEQQLAQVEGELIAAQSNLAQILSLPEQVTASASEAINLEAKMKLSLEENLLLAYEKRPELQQQLAQQKIAQAQQQIALADRLPQVQLVAQSDLLKVLKAGGGNYEEIEGNYWGVGYSLSAQVQWNFFDGGSSRLRAQSAEVDEAIAVTQFTDLRNQIRQEVQQAYSNLQVSERNYQTAQATIAIAQKSLDVARLRFRNGVGTQTDVISAQNDLNQSQLNLLNAMISYNRAIASLKKATGQND